MKSPAPALIALALLGGCATASTVPPPKDASAGVCRNNGLDRYVGQVATAELGAQMLRLSGARTVRWNAPGMAMTMDFRGDRLTVSYDATMKVLSARCG